MEKRKIKCYLTFYNIGNAQSVPVVIMGLPIVEGGIEKIDGFASIYLSAEPSEPEKTLYAVYVVNKPIKLFESFAKAVDFIQEKTGYNVCHLLIRKKVEIIKDFMNQDSVEVDYEKPEEVNEGKEQ